MLPLFFEILSLFWWWKLKSDHCISKFCVQVLHKWNLINSFLSLQNVQFCSQFCFFSGPRRRNSWPWDYYCSHISITYALCWSNWSAVACQSKDKCRCQFLHCWSWPCRYGSPDWEEGFIWPWSWEKSLKHGSWPGEAKYFAIQGKSRYALLLCCTVEALLLFLSLHLLPYLYYPLFAILCLCYIKTLLSVQGWLWYKVILIVLISFLPWSLGSFFLLVIKV